MGIKFPEFPKEWWRSELPYIITLKDGQRMCAYPIYGCIDEDGLKVGAREHEVLRPIWSVFTPYLESDFIKHIGSSEIAEPEDVLAFEELTPVQVS